MALNALLKFVQGALIGADGEALMVAGGAPVTVGNSTGATDVGSWTIELLYAPPGSALFTLVPVVVAAGGATAPTWVFTPDLVVYGLYRIRLTVYSGAGYTGTQDVDIRNVAVVTPNRKFLVFSPQIDPKPLPLTGDGAKPHEFNVNGQPFGWAGGTEPTARGLNDALLFLDSLTPFAGVPYLYYAVALTGQTEFIIPDAPENGVIIMVVNGLVQQPGDYSVVSNVVTYSGVPLVGGANVSIYYWLDSGGGGGGYDPDAVHVNLANEIAPITAKVTPVGADVILIEDSEDSNQKKSIQLSSLPGGVDEKVRVSAADTTAGYLNGKLVLGEGLRSSILNPSAAEELQLDLPVFQHIPDDYTYGRIPQVGYGLSLHPVIMCAPNVVTSDGHSIWVSQWWPTSGFDWSRSAHKNNVARGAHPAGYGSPVLTEQYDWPTGRETSPGYCIAPLRFTYAALYNAATDRMLLLQSTLPDGGGTADIELRVVEYSTDTPAVELSSTLTNISGNQVRYMTDARIEAGYLWLWFDNPGQVYRCSLSDFSTFTLVGIYNSMKTAQVAYDPEDHYGDGEGRFWFVTGSLYLYSVVPSTGVVTLERDFSSSPLYDGTKAIVPIWSVAYDSDRERLWLSANAGDGTLYHGAISFDVNPLFSNLRGGWVENVTGDNPVTYGTGIYNTVDSQFWHTGNSIDGTESAIEIFSDDGSAVTREYLLASSIAYTGPAVGGSKLALIDGWMYLTNNLGAGYGTDHTVTGGTDSRSIVAFRLGGGYPSISAVYRGIKGVDWGRVAWADGDLALDYEDPHYTRVARIGGVSLGGAPVAGQVLTATSATAAEWQTPAPPVSPTVISHSLSSGTNNDVAPTGWAGAGVARLDSPAAAEVTGFAAVLSTDVLQRKLYNVGSYNITLKHQSTGSAAVNRLIVPGDVDLVLEPNDVADIFYDITTARWRVG